MIDESDLWPPDLFSEPIVPPLQILKEQADRLSTLSDRKLLGKIRSHPDEDNYGEQTGYMNHWLDIVVPTMGDYKFELLKVKHQAISNYPATVLCTAISDELVGYYSEETLSEREFSLALQYIFNRVEIKNILRTLKGQVDATWKY